MQITTMLPAYGRTYGTEAAILADWHAGRDFQIFSHVRVCYCSIRDIDAIREQGTTHLRFRIHEFRDTTIAI